MILRAPSKARAAWPGVGSTSNLVYFANIVPSICNIYIVTYDIFILTLVSNSSATVDPATAKLRSKDRKRENWKVSFFAKLLSAFDGSLFRSDKLFRLYIGFSKPSLGTYPLLKISATSRSSSLLGKLPSHSTVGHGNEINPKRPRTRRHAGPVGRLWFESYTMCASVHGRKGGEIHKGHV